MHLPQKKMIELCDVGVAYDGRTALTGVNLTIDEGDFVAITGPNGGGKTTLLKVILQLIAPSTGTVIYRSRGADSHSPCRMWCLADCSAPGL